MKTKGSWQRQVRSFSYAISVGAICFGLLAFNPVRVRAARQNISQMSSGTQAAQEQRIPRAVLYTGLYRLIGHMEERRLANQAGQHVNIAEIEAKLKSKIKLSEADWSQLVGVSVDVAKHRSELDAKATPILIKLRAARQTGAAASLTAAERSTLRSLQTDWKAYCSKSTTDLGEKLSADGSAKLEAYIEGPFTQQGHFLRRPKHEAAAVNQEAR